MALFVRRLLVRAGLCAKKTTAVGRSVFPLTFPPDVAEHVRECYQQAQGIVEYGSGGSTKLAAELGVSCLSVESDPDWAAALTRHLDSMSDEPASAQVMHIDIGTTEAWGYPTDPSHWDQYWRYPLQVWEQDPAPSHVLIDGRMRKACFAATLLNIRRETTILFDDYTDRPFYRMRRLCPIEIFGSSRLTRGFGDCGFARSSLRPGRAHVWRYGGGNAPADRF